MISARLESQIRDAEWDAEAWLDAQAELDRLKMGRLQLADPRAAEALALEM